MAGIVLSALLAALSWGIGAASAVDSVTLGLIGTILAIQFEILVRHEERSEFAELTTGPDWLYKSVKSIMADCSTITTEFRGTAIEHETHLLVQDFCADFNNLRLGRLRRGAQDSHYLVQHTRDSKALILAATNIVPGPDSLRWWQEGPGRAYLRENVAAIERGVVIQRVIIYSEDQHAEAAELAEMQHQAGIQVRLTLRENLLREQRINFAVWDGQVSWEAQMNADGNPIANVYCVGAADIHRLTEIHRALWTNSTGYPHD